MIEIRALAPADRKNWDRLWKDYLAFYGTTLDPEIYDTYFARLMGNDPLDFNGVVAEQDGQMVGLAHYIFHRHGWKVENVCYLQDLYVDPDVRGTGAGRALIEAVYARADAADAPSVYWMTDRNNAQARTLYDRIGELSPFIKYTRV
ncbi:MAG: GNAT family N-acetyltransferase [Litoreibacter sp.]